MHNTFTGCLEKTTRGRPPKAALQRVTVTPPLPSGWAGSLLLSQQASEKSRFQTTAPCAAAHLHPTWPNETHEGGELWTQACPGLQPLPAPSSSTPGLAGPVGSVQLAREDLPCRWLCAQRGALWSGICQRISKPPFAQFPEARQKEGTLWLGSQLTS